MKVPRLARLLALCAAIAVVTARAQEGGGAADRAEILTAENEVEAARPSGPWAPATVGQPLATRDRLRTGEDSRAAVRLADATVLRVDELTETEILPAQQASDKPTLNVKQGGAYFFSREKSREVNVQTPSANGAIRGTEFVVRWRRTAPPASRCWTAKSMSRTAPAASPSAVAKQAEVAPGQRPRKTAMIEATNIIQWCLYYPGVLNLNDLGLSPGAEQGSHASLLAYSEGDLLTALKNYRGGSGSRGEAVYRAGLYLVVGRVDKAETSAQQESRAARRVAMRSRR